MKRHKISEVGDVFFKLDFYHFGCDFVVLYEPNIDDKDFEEYLIEKEY